jgi:hypothetical protein
MAPATPATPATPAAPAAPTAAAAAAAEASSDEDGVSVYSVDQENPVHGEELAMLGLAGGLSLIMHTEAVVVREVTADRRFWRYFKVLLLVVVLLTLYLASGGGANGAVRERWSAVTLARQRKHLAPGKLHGVRFDRTSRRRHEAEQARASAAAAQAAAQAAADAAKRQDVIDRLFDEDHHVEEEEEEFEEEWAADDLDEDENEEDEARDYDDGELDSLDAARRKGRPALRDSYLGGDDLVSVSAKSSTASEFVSAG